MEDKVVDKDIGIISKKKKAKKVGQITFGFTLILLGISVFVQSIMSFEILRYVLMMWPLIFISLGIEIIYYSRKDDINIKYDIWGVILIFIILGCTTIFSVVNYGINKLLYNDEVKNIIVEEMVSDSNTYEFYDKVKLINVGDEKISIKIIEDKNYDGSKVYINGALNSEYLSNKEVIAFLGDRYSISNVIDVKRASRKSMEVEEEDLYNFVTIKALPEWLDSISINIVTNDKNNIQIIGEFNLI